MLPKIIKVNKDKNLLSINWDDGTDSAIKLANLRMLCPCAVCTAEKAEYSDSYIPIYTKEQLAITKIEIIGKYALNLSWEDGHNTGIHEFNQLKEIEQ